MHGIQVGHVDASRVRRMAPSVVLLHVHAEEHDVRAVDFLKGEDGLGAVRVRVGHLILVVVLQAWLHLADLITGCENANGHPARHAAFVAQEVVHALLEASSEIGHRQLEGRVAIALAFDVVIAQARLTDEPFGPDLIEMQRAHLMPTTRAHDAVDHGLVLLNVVLRRQEETLREFDERLRGIVADEDGIILDRIEAFGAERVLVTGQIEARRLRVVVVVVATVAWNLTAQLIAVAEHHLRKVEMLTATAVAERLHDGIDGVGEDLGQLKATNARRTRSNGFSYLGTHFVNASGLLVVQPGVVEHEPGIVAELQRVLVLAAQEFVEHRGYVHGILHDRRIVEYVQSNGIDRLTKRMRVFAGNHLLYDWLETRVKLVGREFHGVFGKVFTGRIDLGDARFRLVGCVRVRWFDRGRCRVREIRVDDFFSLDRGMHRQLEEKNTVANETRCNDAMFT